MLRNVPLGYSRKAILALLDENGFAGLYDFVYLPVDFETCACLGYAFVNLINSALVPPFFKTFDGWKRWLVSSKKICRVCWSGPHQGLEQHVRYYRNSRVMHASVFEEYKPAIFSHGVQVPFPRPTKAIRPPRVRNWRHLQAPTEFLGALQGAQRFFTIGRLARRPKSLW